MNTLRNTLLAACLAVSTLPALAAAPPAPPAPPEAPDTQIVEQKLEDARQRLEAAAREVAELSGQMGRNYAYNFRFGPEGGAPRALLGVMVDRSDQKEGALVREVSPGGAAAEAGIQAGDIITSIGGQDLTKQGDPAQGLVDKMRQIEPNLKVQLGVLRDGKKLTVDVTPRGAALQRRPPGAHGLDGGPMERREIMLHRMGEDGGTRFGGIEFATLSERLGGYFGVKSGVLVVRAGANTPWQLQDGDVILAIDGRAPSSAQHAGRILRSYSAGEKLKLRVQRDRKAQDLEVTVPSGRDGD